MLLAWSLEKGLAGALKLISVHWCPATEEILRRHDKAASTLVKSKVLGRGISFRGSCAPFATEYQKMSIRDSSVDGTDSMAAKSCSDHTDHDGIASVVVNVPNALHWLIHAVGDAAGHGCKPNPRRRGQGH